MAEYRKRDLILDTLMELLKEKKLDKISVSEIAQRAQIAKGSIYYYFASKDEMMEALVERSCKKTLEKSRELAEQTDVSPMLRMATLFHTCVNAYEEYNRGEWINLGKNDQELALLHQKRMHYIVRELKPVLTEILIQGMKRGMLQTDNPTALAEIVLLILTVKLDNYLLPSGKEEIMETVGEMIRLLEKGAGCAAGTLDFMKLW